MLSGLGTFCLCIIHSPFKLPSLFPAVAPGGRSPGSGALPVSRRRAVLCMRDTGGRPELPLCSWRGRGQLGRALRGRCFQV